MDENVLLVFERKIMRKIFGPWKDETTNEWKIRKNKEYQEFYQSPSIIEDITKSRLKWAGHAWRKEEFFLKRY